MSDVITAKSGFPGLVTLIRRQLAVSQEDLARQLGVSYATVNRWENGRNIPSRLARAQLNALCEEMIQHGKLVLLDAPPISKEPSLL
jgi:DNA-binding transcriptional regulator YiaG